MVVEHWRGFIQPSATAKNERALEFPALQDLLLDFSAMDLNDEEGILVRN